MREAQCGTRAVQLWRRWPVGRPKNLLFPKASTITMPKNIHSVRFLPPRHEKHHFILFLRFCFKTRFFQNPFLIFFLQFFLPVFESLLKGRHRAPWAPGPSGRPALGVEARSARQSVESTSGGTILRRYKSALRSIGFRTSRPLGAKKDEL